MCWVSFMYTTISVPNSLFHVCFPLLLSRWNQCELPSKTFMARNFQLWWFETNACCTSWALPQRSSNRLINNINPGFQVLWMWPPGLSPIVLEGANMLDLAVALSVRCLYCQSASWSHWKSCGCGHDNRTIGCREENIRRTEKLFDLM
jgi:hypothetical protein